MFKWKSSKTFLAILEVTLQVAVIAPLQPTFKPDNNFSSDPTKIDISILVGSEEKLLSGLKVGCSGAITATCNVTSKIARKVFDDFHLNIPQTLNEKLCKVRKVFNQFNLISGLHSFMSQKDPIFKNVLPIIDLLSESEEKKLFEELKKLEFNMSY
mgnify:CR=1 FL=1